LSECELYTILLRYSCKISSSANSKNRQLLYDRIEIENFSLKSYQNHYPRTFRLYQ